MAKVYVWVVPVIETKDKDAKKVLPRVKSKLDAATVSAVAKGLHARLSTEARDRPKKPVGQPQKGNTLKLTTKLTVSVSGAGSRRTYEIRVSVFPEVVDLPAKRNGFNLAPAGTGGEPKAAVPGGEPDDREIAIVVKQLADALLPQFTRRLIAHPTIIRNAKNHGVDISR